MALFVNYRILGRTHHHASCDGYAPATVSVRHDIPVSHTQEGDCNEPHSVEQIGMFLIMISVAVTEEGKTKKNEFLIWQKIHLQDCFRDVIIETPFGSVTDLFSAKKRKNRFFLKFFSVIRFF